MVLSLAACTGLAAKPPMVAASSFNGTGSVSAVAVFDELRGQSPEGITIDHDGRIYVAWKPLQQLVRLDADGPAVVNTLPGQAAALGGLIGLATAPDGSILGALASSDPDYNGLWTIRPGRDAHRLAALPSDVFPNDVVVAPDGVHALVTDSSGGRIYRVGLADGRVDMWLHHDLLTPSTEADVPVGANGITFLAPDVVVVANYDRNTLLQVPVEANGNAGSPTVVANVPHPDGVRAHAGELYVAEPFQDQVVRIGADGRRTIVADALQGLDRPFSLVICDGSNPRVLVTNGSLASPANRPGVTQIDLVDADPAAPSPL